MGEHRKRIGVITTNIEVEYVSEILDGILKEAQRHHFDVYIFNANVSTDETLKHNAGQYNIYRLLNVVHFDGIIVFSNLIQGRTIYNVMVKRLESVEIPVVGIDAPFGQHYYVGVENYHSMKAVVEHFIEHHGFKKIDYISGQSFNMDSQLRQQAYCDALKEHGILIEEKRIFPGTFTTEHGRQVALQLVRSKEELPQAIVCGNDSIALGVCDVLKEYGIRVPEQVAVSGFDNMFEARNHVPRLTTVDRSLFSVGEAAMVKLATRLAGGNPAVSDLFPANPIFAGSCGCRCEEKGNIIKIRRRYLDLVDHYENHLYENNSMIEDLNDSTSYSDFVKRLKPYVEDLECTRFYLCLDRKLVDWLQKSDDLDGEEQAEEPLRTKGYGKTMCVAVAYEQGEYVTYEDFPSKQVVPWDTESQTEQVLVFSPVHFQNICYGYVVVEGSEYVLSSALYRMWMINLCNSLENLRKQTNLQKILNQLDRTYVMDSLTRVYNRFGFSRYTKESFAECTRDKQRIMILFADLDGLKKINDRYGHDKGDLAIKTVAFALRRACINGEVCARYGGDEFVVYAAGYSEEDAKNFCRRFGEELDHYNKVLEQPFAIEASLGYELVVPRKKDAIEVYMEKADQKMYREKKLRHERSAGKL